MFTLFKFLRKNNSQIVYKDLLIKCKNITTSAQLARFKINYKSLLISDIPKSKLQSVEDITAIVCVGETISWTELSVDTVTVRDWGSKSTSIFNEPVKKGGFYNAMINFVHSVKKELPESDLYLIENPRSKVFLTYSIILNIATLISNGSEDYPNLVFQQPFVADKVYNMLLRNERISARHIFQNYFRNLHHLDETTLESTYHDKNVDYWVGINTSELEKYHRMTLTEQEGVNLALLQCLSFINVFIHKREPSVKKVLEKKLNTGKSVEEDIKNDHNKAYSSM